MNVIKITEQVPQITTLPDGVYVGVMTGHNVVVKHQGKTYDLETDDGYRGFNINVVATFIDGKGTIRDINN